MEKYLDPWERPDAARRDLGLRQTRWIQYTLAGVCLAMGLFGWWALDRQQRRDERLLAKTVAPFRQLAYYGRILERTDAPRPGDARLLDSLEAAYATATLDSEDSALLESIRDHRRRVPVDRKVLDADFAALVEKNHQAGAEMIASNRTSANGLSSVLIVFTLAASISILFWGGRLHVLQNQKDAATAELLDLLQAAPEAILLLEAGSRTILAANPAASRITGFRGHILRGLPFERLCPPDQAEGSTISQSEHWTRRALEGDEVHTSWLLQRPDGRKVPCELMAVRHPAPGTDTLRVSLVDLSDRFEAEKARDASDQRLWTLMESSILAIRISRGTRTVYANPACVALFGYEDRAKFQHAPITETYAPECREAMLERMRDRQFATAYDAVGLRLDGTTFHLQGSMAPIDLEDGPAVIAFLIDTSETVQARRREAESRAALEHADRLAALGTLSAGIAHEINNPNNLILLNTDLLERILPETLEVVDRHAETDPGFRVGGLPWPEMREEITALIEGLHGGGERIRTLVAGLKDFVRQEPSSRRSPLDLNAVVVSARRLLKGLVQASTDHFEVDFAPDLPLILANHQQIEQIVVNLVSNACQALPDRSCPIRVSTRTASDGWVELEVRDRGRGIPPENLPRILDPFFTTRREQGGTGLGLSVSWGIVQAHQGQLSIANAPEGGAVATLRLRAADLPEEIA